ncbi:hypothetical protein Gotri_020482, partial [Gossypium trilobum]|nr:hypothetical protein [Gossypium trilobum]
PQCCSEVANINAAATTPAIRRDLCRCFKKAGHGAGVVSDKAKQLPRLCDVRVAVPIDPTDQVGNGNVVLHVTMNKSMKNKENKLMYL